MKPAAGGKRAAKIVIVDDHPVVRQGLARLLDGESGLVVVGESDGPAAALDVVRDTRPDLVIADLTLGDGSGLELVKEVKAKHPDIPVLVFSVHDESFFAERALRAGARGYIMKDAPAARVIDAVRHVLAGKVFVSEEIAASMLGRIVGRKTQGGPVAVDRLSDRELQVFRLIGRGIGTRKIAEKLGISVKTVENHRDHIKTKLNVATSPELVRYAVQFEIEAGQ